jgi:hypothetical protein
MKRQHGFILWGLLLFLMGSFLILSFDSQAAATGMATGPGQIGVQLNAVIGFMLLIFGLVFFFFGAYQGGNYTH